MFEMGPWDYTFEWSISMFQMQSSDEAEGTFLEGSSVYGCPQNVLRMSDDICVGGDVTGGKKKCGAILRFNGTLKGNTRFLLLVNLPCFASCSFFSPGPGKSKTKGEGGGSAAVLGPVTSLMEQIWSSSSLESSSMLSHKALFCQQSERREMGERKKKENVIQGAKIA